MLRVALSRSPVPQARQPEQDRDSGDRPLQSGGSRCRRLPLLLLRARDPERFRHLYRGLLTVADLVVNHHPPSSAAVRHEAELAGLVRVARLELVLRVGGRKNLYFRERQRLRTPVGRVDDHGRRGEQGPDLQIVREGREGSEQNNGASGAHIGITRIRIVRTKILALGSLTAAAALAHYTWIAPQTSTIVAGKAATLTVAHGHKFPVSEEAVNATQVKMWVVAPSGVKTPVTPIAQPGRIGANFQPKESGVHQLVFTQDRGWMSRTPRGVKPGGKDKNPDATQSFRIFRSGIAYTGLVAAPAPHGLETELTASLAQGKWTVRLYKDGKPLAGQTVQVLQSGQKDGTDIGKTSGDGTVTFAAPAGVKSPMLFLAEFEQGEQRYSTSLYVSW